MKPSHKNKPKKRRTNTVKQPHYDFQLELEKLQNLYRAIKMEIDKYAASGKTDGSLPVGIEKDLMNLMDARNVYSDKLILNKRTDVHFRILTMNARLLWVFTNFYGQKFAKCIVDISHVWNDLKLSSKANLTFDDELAGNIELAFKMAAALNREDHYSNKAFIHIIEILIDKIDDIFINDIGIFDKLGYFLSKLPDNLRENDEKKSIIKCYNSASSKLKELHRLIITPIVDQKEPTISDMYRVVSANFIVMRHLYEADYEALFYQIKHVQKNKIMNFSSWSAHFKSWKETYFDKIFVKLINMDWFPQYSIDELHNICLKLIDWCELFCWFADLYKKMATYDPAFGKELDLIYSTIQGIITHLKSVPMINPFLFKTHMDKLNEYHKEQNILTSETAERKKAAESSAKEEMDMEDKKREAEALAYQEQQCPETSEDEFNDESSVEEQEPIKISPISREITQDQLDLEFQDNELAQLARTLQKNIKHIEKALLAKLENRTPFLTERYLSKNSLNNLVIQYDKLKKSYLQFTHDYAKSTLQESGIREGYEWSRLDIEKSLKAIEPGINRIGIHFQNIKLHCRIGKQQWLDRYALQHCYSNNIDSIFLDKFHTISLEEFQSLSTEFYEKCKQLGYVKKMGVDNFKKMNIQTFTGIPNKTITLDDFHGRGIELFVEAGQLSGSNSAFTKEQEFIYGELNPAFFVLSHNTQKRLDSQDKPVKGEEKYKLIIVEIKRKEVLNNKSPVENLVASLKEHDQLLTKKHSWGKMARIYYGRAQLKEKLTSISPGNVTLEEVLSDYREALSFYLSDTRELTEGQQYRKEIDITDIKASLKRLTEKRNHQNDLKENSAINGDFSLYLFSGNSRKAAETPSVMTEEEKAELDRVWNGPRSK